MYCGRSGSQVKPHAKRGLVLRGWQKGCLFRNNRIDYSTDSPGVMGIFKLKFFGNITWLGDFFVGKRTKNLDKRNTVHIS